jgi:hypothetical protein
MDEIEICFVWESSKQNRLIGRVNRVEAGVWHRNLQMSRKSPD